MFGGGEIPSHTRKSLSHDEYTVAWVCPLEVELIAALEMLDEEHERLPQQPADHNVYTLGSIAGHNLVIATLPIPGNSSAATVVTQLRMTFPNIRFGLLVGIGGGVPVTTDNAMIRLGDIVVSKPTEAHLGCVQYDHGKAYNGLFQRTGALPPPPAVLLQAAQDLAAKRARSRRDSIVQNIKRIDTNQRGLRRFKCPGATQDRLFPSNYIHLEPGLSCEQAQCDFTRCIGQNESDPMDGIDLNGPIVVHRGTVASGELVVKDSFLRDRLASENNVLCFEMEAAGSLFDFPCLVIWGISDYCDSHKNDQWHGYAAAAAAAYARQLFFHIPMDEVKRHPVPAQLKIDLAKLALRSDMQQQQDIGNWLSKTDYGTFQADSFSRSQEGTGKWFLNTREFQAWVENRDTLFCPGIPGAGKTIMTSIVVDHLRQTTKDSGTAIVYIYCSFLQKHDQTLRSMLANILKQLVLQAPFLPEDVNDLHDCYRNDPPPSEQLYRCILSTIGKYPRTYILVDALDECEVSAMNYLLDRLFDLQTKQPFGLLVTSRFIPAITSRFNSCRSLKIHASTADVKLYLQSQLDELPPFVSRDAVLQSEIFTEIIELADGMFLLSKLYIDSLKKKRSPKALKNALRQLPGGSDAYDQAYEEAMHRVECQVPDQRDLAIEVLSWLTCSKRALTLTELQHALGVEFHEPFLDEENLPEPKDMLAACARLAAYDERSHVIRLVHYTTQEYFERTWSRWAPQAHSMIGNKFITYMSYDVFATGPFKTIGDFFSRLKKYPLLEYFVQSLAYHALLQPVNEEMILGFLNNHQMVLSYYQVAYYFQGRWDWDDIRETTGIHLAAELGLEFAVEVMSKNTTSIDLKNAIGDTPLIAAIGGGQEGTAKLLVTLGADPNRQNSWGQSPLFAAANYGHPSIVEFLLSLKVDPAQKDPYGRTPLFVAVIHGHVEVVKLLMKTECDPDCIDIDGHTALSLAADWGKDTSDVFLAMLKGGANPNLGKKFPLSSAARHDHSAVVKILLEHHAQIGATDSDGNSAVSWAFEEGREETLAILLENGAEMREIKKMNHTSSTHLRVVRILLQHGLGMNCTFAEVLLKQAIENSDLNMVILLKRYWRGLDFEVLAKARCPDKLMADLLHKRCIYPDSGGPSPLLWAAENSRILVGALLLNQGISPNNKDPVQGETALCIAAKRGDADFVKLLLENGASVNSQDNIGRTPLSKAAKHNHEDVIILLLEHNADPAIRDSFERVPLSYAIEYADSFECIEILLQKDDRLLHDGDIFGRTPLLLAAEKTSEDVMGLFRRANVINDRQTQSQILKDGIGRVIETIPTLPEGIVQQLGGDCLVWAAKNGRRPIVESLVERRVDLNTKDSEGATAISWASRNGHNAVIDFLIRQGAVIHFRHYDGSTPLKWAIDNSREKAVELLLCSRAQTTQEPYNMDRDEYTETSGAHEHESALWLAVRKKHEGVVRLLLQYGYPELYSTRRTNLLLELAINSNLAGIVQILLEHASGGYVLDKCAELHLFQAAKLGFAEVVELLLKKGVNANCKIAEMSQLHGESVYESTGSEWRTTPLTVAAENGDYAVVKTLLENGADPEAKGAPLAKPLEYAVQGGHGEIAALLLEKGARWAFKGDHTSLLVDSVQMGHANIVKIFLEQGANCETRDQVDGWSLLLLAASACHEEVVRVLVDAGANLNCRAQRRSRGRTALSISASCGYEGIVKILLESGADPNIPDDHGATPLLRAAESGHNTIIQLLLHHGAHVDAVDKSNRTALFVAALNGYRIATRALLMHGSKAIHRATSAGRSPFSVANEHHPFHILPILSPELAASNEMRSSTGDRCASRNTDISSETESVGDSEADTVAADNAHYLCNGCDFWVTELDDRYRCGICKEALDFILLCPECIASGIYCHDKLHMLEKGKFVHGKWEGSQTIRPW